MSVTASQTLHRQSFTRTSKQDIVRILTKKSQKIGMFRLIINNKQLQIC